MLKTLSVSKKAFGAFALLAIICALTGIATITNVFSLRHAAETQSNITVVRDQLAELQKDINTHAFVGDSFLLSSETTFRTTYEEGFVELQREFSALETAFEKVAPQLSGDLKQTRAAWADYSDAWMSEQMRLMERPDTIDLARARESAGEGRRRFEAAGKSLDAVSEKLSAISATAAARADQAAAMILWISVGAALVTLGTSIGLGILFNAVVSKPLRDIRNVTTQLADGRIDMTIPETDSQDEVGDISRALSVFQTNLQRTRQLEADQQAAKARSEEEKRSTLNEIARSFESEVMGSISEMTKAIENLKGLSENVTSGADATGNRANEVSAATHQTANNITAVAGAAEEMSATIAEISQRVNEVARIAGQGETASTAVNTQVSQLTTVVEQIESVVRLIAAIAEQTNLLALNATIEAARAGESGRGFAVVASEVKELASQTAKATDDVSRQIAEIRTSTRNVADAAVTVNDVIAKLNEISGAIAAAMEQQGASTQEIANSVDHAATAAGSVSDSISHVASIAEETGRASRQIDNEAGHLIERARLLQSQSGTFIKNLLAG